MIVVRAATEEDMPRILEIEKETISPPWTHGGLLSEIHSEDSYFALAIENSTILGFIILRRMADESELLQIAIDETYRRKGAAETLIKAAFNWAHINEISTIYLEVRKSNEAAIALYKKHSFKESGQRKNYYTEPVEDALIMVKNT